MRSINKKTGEINSIQPGGLYAPLPIPAYQVLARMKEHQAQKVLVCIVSHLGSNGRESFPSYSTIEREAGIGRSGIRPALDVLEEFGFIKVHTVHKSNRAQNKYYIQEAAYNSGLMNKFAKQYRNVTAACKRCGSGMDRGGYEADTPRGPIHYGCGGSVKIFKKEGKSVASKVAYPS